MTISISVANYYTGGQIQITQNNTVMGTVAAASSTTPTIGTVEVTPGVAISIQAAPKYDNVCNVAAVDVQEGLSIRTNVPWGQNPCPCNQTTQTTWPSSGWPQLFTGSTCGDDGTVGCMQQGKGICNDDWNSYTATDETSITITAGNDCRTICTNNLCNFSLGNNGVTQIAFDFEVINPIKTDGTAIWLAFWIYCKSWQQTEEVDFIESLYGPGTGLNTNFADQRQGNQVVIYLGPGSNSEPWTGSITANFFTNQDGTVLVSVSNSVNSNVGTATLASSTGSETGYFFVLDTCPTDQLDCSITISKLNVVGSWQGVVPN